MGSSRRQAVHRSLEATGRRDDEERPIPSGARWSALVVLLAVVASAFTVVVPPTAAAAAAAGAWPTAWRSYTFTDGSVVRDARSEPGISPPASDLNSGPCTGNSCSGSEPSVFYTSDGANAFFRMRLSADNNDASKGGLFGQAFLVQLADASGAVKAVVGVDGKDSTADYVYVTDSVGGVVKPVHTYPFTGAAAGMRWIPAETAGDYFLDFQVPIAAVAEVSRGALTATTPIKMYYGTSAAQNLAVINKDYMIAGDKDVSFANVAVVQLTKPTATFETAGGTPIAAQTLTPGSPATRPTDPTRPGYVFAGWYTAPTGGTTWDFASPVTIDTTLYAGWATPTWTVTFDTAGGSVTAPLTVTDGDVVTAPLTPSRAGSTFRGWYTAPDGGTEYAFSTPVTAARTLYAQWTAQHTVVFDAHDGSAVAEQTVDDGQKLRAPTAPVRTGYTFEGWYTQETDGQRWSFADDTVTAATTLHARWVAIPKLTQEITFLPPAYLTIDQTGPLLATASSDLPVTFTSSTPAVCTVAGGAVTATAAGTCIITAEQDGNAIFAAASPQERSFTVHKKSQTLSFPDLAGALVGEAGPLEVTATSGLRVELRSLTADVCTIDGAVVTAVAAGECTIEAAQSGDPQWAPADAVTRSFDVRRPGLLPQAIDFPALADTTVAETFAAAAHSTWSLPVTVTSSTPLVCTVTVENDALVVRTVSAGTCVLTATQPGTPIFAPADDVVRSFTVTQRPQVITFAPLPSATIGDEATLQPTASSGLPVTVTSDTPAVCRIDSDGAVSFLSAGDCTATAHQAGDATYAAATTVTRTVEVLRKPQTITFDRPAEVTASTTFTPTVNATSDLPVTMTTETPAVCTVAERTVTVHAAGTCTLTATQDGDDTFAPAVAVTESIVASPAPQPPAPQPPAPQPPAPQPPVVGPPVVGPPVEPKKQTIRIDAPSVLLSGAGPVAVSATATSGLPVTLEVVAGDCLLDGGRVVAAVDARCSIRAVQDGNTEWAPAEPVTTAIDFVSPHDDAVSMASPTTGVANLTVPVLANDPAGLQLASVDAPANGTTRVSDSSVLYSAPDRFRGVDSFAYTVRDTLGRTARAHVTVDVGNAAPQVTGARIKQVAGTTRTVTVAASDPNGDPVHLTATSGKRVSVAVDGHRIAITPDSAVSGWAVVTVTADDGAGGIATTTIRSLVSPRPVTQATKQLTDDGTRVAWSQAATSGARYRVLVDGQQACVTKATACTIGRFLGPDFAIRVQVLGADDTVSTRTLADPRGHRQVLLRTVYFASGVDVLDRGQRQKFASVARLIRRLGFHDVHVSGYTDSDGGAAYNLALSRRRTLMVTTYLHRAENIRSMQAWFGYDDPAASNASAAGKALNRRVEILVSY